MTPHEFEKRIADFCRHLKIERNLAQHTYRAYECDLKLFHAFWTRIQEQEKITIAFRPAYERYLTHLYYKKINKNSIARKLSTFASFLRYLQTCGIHIELPMERPRLDKKLPVYLGVDEIFFLLDTVSENSLPSQHPIRDKAILELLYATGIRCSELVSITIQDIDFSTKAIRIKGKRRQERMVLFGQKAHDKLLEYITKERPAITSPAEPLFLNYRRTALTPRSIQRILEMFRSYLKIKRPITPHTIRHSFATHMLNQGLDLRALQELLGHKTIASTEKYTHVSLPDLIEQCEKRHPINDILKKRMASEDV